MSAKLSELDVPLEKALIDARTAASESPASAAEHDALVALIEALDERAEAEEKD